MLFVSSASPQGHRARNVLDLLPSLHTRLPAQSESASVLALRTAFCARIAGTERTLPKRKH